MRVACPGPHFAAGARLSPCLRRRRVPQRPGPEVSAPARADSLGLRNAWRGAATRLQATSLRWFPAISSPSCGPRASRPRASWMSGVIGGRVVRTRFAAVAPSPSSRVSRAVRLAGSGERTWWPESRSTSTCPRMVTPRRFLRCDLSRGRARARTRQRGARPLTALPAESRYDALLDAGLLARYEGALEGLVADRAAALRTEVRRLNPDLRSRSAPRTCRATVLTRPGCADSPRPMRPSFCGPATARGAPSWSTTAPSSS